MEPLPGYATSHDLRLSIKPTGSFSPALLAGYGRNPSRICPAIIKHITQHKPGYLWIVHVHGPVFVGWLALLTIQLTLIRILNVARTSSADRRDRRLLGGGAL